MPAELYSWLPSATVLRWLKVDPGNTDAVTIAEDCRRGSAGWIEDQRPDLFPIPNLIAYPRGDGWTPSTGAAFATLGPGFTVAADPGDFTTSRTIGGLTVGDHLQLTATVKASEAARALTIDGTWVTAETAGTDVDHALTETISLPDADVSADLVARIGPVPQGATALRLELTYDGGAGAELVTVSTLELAAVSDRILSAAQLAVARLYARKDSPNGVVAFDELQAGALLARDPDIRRLLGRAKLVVG